MNLVEGTIIIQFGMLQGGGTMKTLSGELLQIKDEALCEKLAALATAASFGMRGRQDELPVPSIDRSLYVW